MAVTSISIRNFQSHKKLTIDLSPTVTTIVGSTDKGKSAIIRALKWVATGNPTGDGFVNWDGATRTKVCVKIDDSSQIQRTKRKGGKSAYTIRHNGRKHLLKAFGKTVPDEIQKVLNLDEINFQSQHDSPFWFSESSGEVSRQLNAVVDLSLIDRMLSNLDRQIRTAKARVAVTKENYLDAKDTVKRLFYVPGMIADKKAMDALHSKWKSLYEKTGEIRTLLVKLREAKREARKIPNIDTSKLDLLLARHGEIALKRKALGVHIAALNNARKEVIQSKREAIRCNHLFHKHTKNQHCPLCHQKLK